MDFDDDTPISNDAAVNNRDECEKIERAIDDNKAVMERQMAVAVDQPEEKNTNLYRAAGFWIRLLAFAIDLAVIACLNAIIWDSIFPPEARQSFIYGIIQKNTLFLGLTGAAYFILMTRYFEQTLGKMITGIKVIQRSGDPLSWTTIIFRELVARSLSQLMGLNLGYIFCWFNSEKRCLHDFLSDTWVVYVKLQSQNGLIAVENGNNQ